MANEPILSTGRICQPATNVLLKNLKHILVTDTPEYKNTHRQKIHCLSDVYYLYGLPEEELMVELFHLENKPRRDTDNGVL